jgi:hypothetical protein
VEGEAVVKAGDDGGREEISGVVGTVSYSHGDFFYLV